METKQIVRGLFGMSAVMAILVAPAGAANTERVVRAGVDDPCSFIEGLEVVCRPEGSLLYPHVA